MMQSNQEITDIPKAYEPQSVEQRLYQMWMDGGYFTPRIDPSKKPFVIIMPPPNVTGELHLGHALQATLADIMTRWHRMKGDPTLWLPGADHAGIATQVMVERALSQEGLTRQQLGRDLFLERVWDWVVRYGHTIDEQHKRIGVSCDWTRRRFTLDEGPSHAVSTTFVNMFNKGLIYRGERIINWCPRCSTALSDLEVDHQDEQSYLYHIRYPKEDGSGYVTVATTRPETLLGDTAVAVNPEDPRYKGLVGQRVLLPVLNRPLPVIADEAVDPTFGTGALKITPGHDPVDFEVGHRHNLPIVTAMNLDGTMNQEAGPYQGMERFECRDAILKDLERDGLLEKMEPYSHSVGHCGRCDVAIEPLVSKQWFMRMEDLARPAMDVVRNGRIRMIPDRFAKVYLNWMENIRDWCISRQLWWGHRIPVWYCTHCDGDKITLALSGERVSGAITDAHLNERPGQAEPREMDTLRGFLNSGKSLQEIDSRIDTADIGMDVSPILGLDAPDKCPSCGATELLQDPDVLDTWFSSALWPHSTLGWPEDSADMRYFYSTSVMETGYDILFFWVARMIIMGLENTGEIPFRHVYLSGLIRDEHGQKMSKTRGNVVDPINAIDTYGTDALRFSLTTGNAPGNDMRLNQGKLAASRNFINKVWNAARFVLTTMNDTHTMDGWDAPSPAHRQDRWIISRLNRVAGRVDRFVEDFQFGEAQRELHDFFWSEFCDWYIEMAKIRLRAGEEPSPLPILVHVLEKSLRLMHPFIPFVTEELWQSLKTQLIQNQPSQGQDMPKALMIAPYPGPDVSLLDDQAEQEMELLTGVVRAIRNVRAEFKIPPNQQVQGVVEVPLGNTSLSEEGRVIRILARTEPLLFQEAGSPRPPTDKTVTAILNGATVLVSLEGLVDTAQERGRLEKEMGECLQNIQRLSRRLGAAEFLDKAPEEVVERERERLANLEERRDRIQEYLGQLGA